MVGRQIGVGKAPGPDSISPEATNILLSEFPEAVATVHDKLLERGEYPERWKTARIVLIPKPGKPLDNPASYRPLCMLDTLGKAFEKVIASRLIKHLEDESALSDRQYGFRRKRSTCLAINSVLKVAEQK